MYKGEEEHADIFGSAKVVAMEKERPKFFSSNLMQGVNRKKDADDTTKTIRPSELG